MSGSAKLSVIAAKKFWIACNTASVASSSPGSLSELDELYSATGVDNMKRAEKFRASPWILALVIGLAIISSYVIARTFETPTFSQEVWKNSSFKATGANSRNPRKGMIADLANNCFTNKTSRKDVILLLGPPDLPVLTSDCALWYYLGAESKFGDIMPPSLYLVLDFTNASLKEWRLEKPD